MNPCSLECLQEPLVLPDKSQVWLMMVGCYELQEIGTRLGRLELFPIRVPDIRSSHYRSIPLQIPEPSFVHAKGMVSAANVTSSSSSSSLSGVLDGKWIKAHPSSTTSCINESSFYFAAAHSSGHISIYSLTMGDHDDGDKIPIQMHLAASSENVPSSTHADPSPLCLSLSWNTSEILDGASSNSIVSSYSNGTVKVHECLRTGNSEDSSHHMYLVERASWVAHTMFTSPAEVWSAAFLGSSNNNSAECQAVMTGGDDGKLKLWDTRMTTRPMQVLNHFDAGVTVVSPHPRNPNLVACGSYDETMCLYDIRFLNPKKPLGRSAPLGGGIWRIKWHPFDDDRVLVAAMHGGCRIVKIDEMEDNSCVFLATKQFTEHKSMAYGADWLVCSHPTREGYFEAAASCSFYDKALYLWDTVV